MNDSGSPRTSYSLPPVEPSILEAFCVGYTNPPLLSELVSIYGQRSDTKFCQTALDDDKNFCVCTNGFRIGDSTFKISDYQLFEIFVDSLLADQISEDKWLERIQNAKIDFCSKLQ